MTARVSSPCVWKSIVYLLVQVGKDSVQLSMGKKVWKVWVIKNIFIIRIAQRPPVSPKQMGSTVPFHTLPSRFFFLKRIISFFKASNALYSPLCFREDGRRWTQTILLSFVPCSKDLESCRWDLGHIYLEQFLIPSTYSRKEE